MERLGDIDLSRQVVLEIRRMEEERDEYFERSPDWLRWPPGWWRRRGPEPT